jgi:hypothetical protein
MSSLTLAGGSIAVNTPFNRAFVDDLKLRVPYAGRRWNATTKQWLVDPQYGPLVATLINQYFGEQVTVPTVSASAAPAMKMAQVLYLGRCKDRGDGSVTASGYADGAWSLSFPEAVLRTYFNDNTPLATPNAPAAPTSLYAVLGLPAFAEADAIKAAYKRMAKLWHPDINREESATDRFQKINHAYDVLKDDKQRRKYDVGLLLEQRANQRAEPTPRYTPTTDYRAPLTCGLLMVEGIEKLGVLHVTKILHWADITNDQGQTMVSSWPAGSDNFETRWI